MTTPARPVLPDELRDALPRRIAHALRTPLGLVQSALQELKQGETEDPLWVLGHRGVHQLARLADRLSLLARLQRGDPATATPVNLASTLDRAVEDIARTRPRRSVRVERGAVPEPVLVRAQVEPLQAALAELVDNAVRFARRSVELRVRCLDAQVIVEIDDDGPGPVATSTSTSESGLGLGLPLVRSIVTMYGGRFELTSTGDHGARATLILEAATES